jgi:murein DD-endopeptidase MepM/ murein hydrolase activator NlpD
MGFGVLPSAAGLLVGLMWWDARARRGVVSVFLWVACGCSTLPVRATSAPEPVDPWAHLPGYALIWPAAGRLAADFGPRGEGHHDGIDIRGPEGLPIRAVLDGAVAFSGALRGYGKVVILRHSNALTTIYAHNQTNLVPAGVQVRRGTVIALLGRTGRAAEPNLHFEVRRHNEARDPLRYLPRRVGMRNGSTARSGS